MPDQPIDYEPVTEVSTEPWVPLPPEEWTEPEKWVWEQVRTGQEADFNKRYGKELDPKDESLWVGKEKERRTIRPDFLRTILLSEPWRGLITHVGVRILGAFYAEDIDLGLAEIVCELWLERSRSEGGLSGWAARFKFNFSLDGSALAKKLNLDGAEIQGDLILRQGCFSSARLHGVQVGGQLSMTGAEFSGELNMDRAVITGNLFLRQSHFTSAKLLGVQVGGQLSTSGSEFSGELNMDRAVIAGNLFLRQGRFASARLLGIQVGGQLSMIGAKFSGELAMDGAEIKGDLFLRQGCFSSARLLGVRVGGQLAMEGAGFKEQLDYEGIHIASHLLVAGARFFDEVNLSFCRVGGGLSLVGSHLGEVNLSQSEISGTLYLSYPGQEKAISWYKGILDLRHTTVGAVMDGQQDWPASLRLDGFRYTSLGSRDTENDIGALPSGKNNFTTTSDRPASWYVDWLEKQKDFSMDPYQQCAKFLRESGQPDKANEVMYAGLERERKQLKKWSKPWLGRTLLKWTIGYGLGYRYFRALFWAVLFLFIGAVVCGVGGGSSHGALFCFGFSLDDMLPLVDLRPEHAAMSIALKGFPKFYFLFIHQIVGWVLLLCVAAGLAGVGKPGGRD